MGRERDWQRARERDLMRVRSEARTLTQPPKKPKPRGITKKQAGYLATLQTKAGIPYTGDSLTADQASREIQRLVDASPEPPKHVVQRRLLVDRVEHLEQDVKALTERLTALERQT